MRRPEWTIGLLRAVEENEIPKADLAAEHWSQLKQSPNPARKNDRLGIIHHIKQPKPKPADFTIYPVVTGVRHDPAGPPFSPHTASACSRLASSNTPANASRIVA
jgi:hypothetical protein